MPNHTTGYVPPGTDQDVRTAYSDEIYRDGELIATCATPEDARTLVALLNEAEEAAAEYAASARASAVKLAYAHSGARKLLDAVIVRHQQWTREIATGVYYIERRMVAEEHAAAWKQAAKDWRERATLAEGDAAMFSATVRDLSAEAMALTARLRALIAAGGATAAELRDLVE